jgi:hypothetical protein
VDPVRLLIEQTVELYISPSARITRMRLLPLAEEEQGWSGAELRRYRVDLNGGEPATFLTKTMPLVERQVGVMLSQHGHAH